MDHKQSCPVRTLLICLSSERSSPCSNDHDVAKMLRHLPSITLVGQSSLCLAGRLLQEADAQLVLLHAEELSSLSPELMIDLVNSTDAKVALHVPLADEDQAINALRIGIRGIIPHGSEPHELEHALERISAGEIWASRKLLSDAFIRTLPSLAKPTSHQAELEDLTPREQEIVERLCSGLSNKEIARELNISDKTVKTHLQRIYRKNQVHSRLQLAISS